MANFVASGQRVHIPNQLIRLSHVPAHNPHKRFIHYPTGREFHDRNVEPFFIDARRIRPKAASTDINDMGSAGKEPDQRAAMERRCDHRDIVQVARPLPRVVRKVDITFINILTSDPTDEMRNSVCHRVDVTRRASNSLRQHLPLKIINASRQIASLAHRR